MRTVAGILFFETIPIIMKILWESLSDRLLLDHVETECGNREVFQRHSFYFHRVALITKVSFLSLYVY